MYGNKTAVLIKAGFKSPNSTWTFNNLEITSGYVNGGMNVTVRGIYYNPDVSSLTGTYTHRAIQTVTGDVLFGTTSGVVGIGTTNLSTEANLYLGAKGTTEGGQLILQKGTAQTYATHLDNYTDQFRIMYGTDTGSTGIALAVSMSTKQLILPAYTTTSSFSGTVVGYLAFDSSGNVLTVTAPSGAVTSVNAGTGVSVSSTTGNVTVSIGQSVATSATPSFDQVFATNNGNGTNFKVGDDAWIGDVNTADTFRVMGQQNATNGYIIFGNSNFTALGRSGTGALTYGGYTIYHSNNSNTITALGTITTGVWNGTAITDTYISSASTWNAKQNALTLTTTGTSGAATLVGATLNIPQYQSVLTNPVTGTGTTNYVTKWTSSSAVGSSVIYDNGTSIVIGSTVANPVAASSKSALTLRKFSSGNASTSISDSYYLGVGGNEYTVGSYRLLGFGYVETANSSTYPAYIGYKEQSTSGYTYGALIFGTRSTTGATDDPIERMRVESSGNLLIGTTTDNGYKLQVNGQINIIGPSNGIYTNAAANELHFSGSYNSYIGSDYTALLLGAGGSERMRITTSGNVGIGTTSPASRLHISGTGTSAWLTIERTDSNTNIIDFTQSGTRLGYIGYISNELLINNVNSSSTVFTTSSLERMRLSAAGNLLIGSSTDAGYKLDVIGSGRVFNSMYVASSAYPGSYYTSLRSDASANGILQFGNNNINYILAGNTFPGGFLVFKVNVSDETLTSGIEAMRITASGNLLIGTTTNNGAKLQVSGTIRANGSYGQVDVDPTSGAFRFYDGSTFRGGFGTDAWATGGSAVNLTTYLDTGNYYIYSNSTASKIFTALSSGNIGINTTSPGAKLHIVDNSLQLRISGNSTDFYVYTWGGGTNIYGTENIYFGRDAGANNKFFFQNASATATALYVNTATSSIGVGTTSPASTAILDVSSTTKGFLPPRMTASQRTSISTPATGLVVYQTDGVEGLYVNTSSGWKALTVV